MELNEAIKLRHSVRRYLDKPLSPEVSKSLQEAIESANGEAGLHIQLVTEEPKAFSSGILKYGAFSGVRNYLVMAAGKGKDETVGYYGEKIVLLAKTLGLSSCWVGLTYKKIPGTFELAEGEEVYCFIALGYGADEGVQHKLKPVENFYEAESEAPAWFLSGMEAALLAPTAINQQKFKFILKEGNKVKAVAGSSLAGYTKIDLGIVKYHFEVGAGAGNFEWA